MRVEVPHNKLNEIAGIDRSAYCTPAIGVIEVNMGMRFHSIPMRLIFIEIETKRRPQQDWGRLITQKDFNNFHNRCALTEHFKLTVLKAYRTWIISVSVFDEIAPDDIYGHLNKRPINEQCGISASS
jgi:hypothetical protein